MTRKEAWGRIRDLPDVWKVLIAAGGLIGALEGAHVVFDQQRALPGRVQAVESRVDTLESGMRSVQRSVTDLVRINRQTLCMQVAQAQNTPWQECIQ